ncbi:uncharacterized protein LOC133902936 [Phragmites australis]|uniref:uncharacterized protein LOC133902936 n=1 Tax=Phragmites australis TaxID=29695 RepID=UPI002D79C2EA|nr:uncharacterized protein LOC133902936 [Phragmites australis]
MNPPSRFWPFGELHGCDGEGCASGLDTWPLHHVYRRGARCRLCSSCILLSNRSLYCCCCFLLLACPSPSSNYDDGDPLRAPPAPTATCQVCHAAVAHLACLYPAHDAFVCPACSATAEGTPFTYAPPCRVPLDGRAARVLVLGARMALAQLRQDAAAARAEAERRAREATAARRRAYRALSVALDLDTEEPSWNINVQPVAPPPPKNHLAPEESREANVDAPPVQRYARLPMAALTIGTGAVTELAMAATEAAKDSPTPPRTLKLFGVMDVATAAAAAEAARASPTPPRMLQLFPAEASTSHATSRTLQLFMDKTPDDDDDDEM